MDLRKLLLRILALVVVCVGAASAWFVLLHDSPHHALDRPLVLPEPHAAAAPRVAARLR